MPQGAGERDQFAQWCGSSWQCGWLAAPAALQYVPRQAKHKCIELRAGSASTYPISRGQAPAAVEPARCKQHPHAMQATGALVLKQVDVVRGRRRVWSLAGQRCLGARANVQRVDRHPDRVNANLRRISRQPLAQGAGRTSASALDAWRALI